MSLDDLENKEKTSVLNLDSDSDFDKKSLAKSISININDPEIEKLEEFSAKEEDKNYNLNEEQIKNSNISGTKEEKLLQKEEFVAPSEVVSVTKAHGDREENGDEELLIIEKPSDINNLFNSGKFVEDYNLKKNISVETNNYNINLFEKKMGSGEITNNSNIDKNCINEDNKKITDDGNADITSNRIQEERTILQQIEILDKNLSLIIHDWHLGKNFDFLIYIFARLFNPDFIVSYLIFILSYKIYSNNDYFFVLKPVASTVFCLAVTLTLKKHFGRSRPDYSKKSKRIFDLRRHEKNCSMPSGDSLQASNFAVILCLYFNSNLGFFLIPFVMFARVYFYCHFISDTVVGAILGIFSSSLVYYFINLY